MPSVGPIYATVGLNDNSSGGVPWSDPENAVGNNINDSIAANATRSAAPTESTSYLKLTFAHGLSASDSIVGFEMAFRRFSTDVDDLGTVQDFAVRLVKDGVISGLNKSAGASWPKDAGGWSAVFGGALDTWGVTLGGANEVGVALSGVFSGLYDVAFVTAARATFHYTTSSSGLLLARRRLAIQGV